MSDKFVSIHGSYNQLEIGLFEDDVCVDLVLKSDTRASSDLLPILNSILNKHSYSLNNLSFIAIDKGPGAFTSLRVTIATINGIAFQNKIPLIGISGLEALTRQIINDTNPDSEIIVTLLNAYNNDAYFLISKIEANADSIIAQGCQNIETLLDNLKTRFNNEHKILFCGQGSQLYKNEIKKVLSDRLIKIDDNHLLASAKTIGIMAHNRWTNKENIDNQITPLYLKTQLFAIRK